MFQKKTSECNSCCSIVTTWIMLNFIVQEQGAGEDREQRWLFYQDNSFIFMIKTFGVKAWNKYWIIIIKNVIVYSYTTMKLILLE